MQQNDWQKLFKLVMSLGAGTDLGSVLGPFVREWSKQLNGVAGGIYFLRSGPKNTQSLYPVCTQPNGAEQLPLFRLLLNSLPREMSPSDWQAFVQTLPRSAPLEGHFGTILEVTDFGVMVFLHRTPIPFEPDTCRTLSEHVAKACTSWIQFTQLQDFQTKMARANKDLREKTIELENSQHQLAESEKKYRTIFENVQDVFFHTDLGFHIGEINPAIYRYTGFSKEQILGKSMSFLFSNPSDFEAFEEALEKYGEVSDYEVAILHKTGKVVFASINAHALLDHQGRLGGAEGTFRDVTEKKIAADKFNATYQRLRTIIEHLQSGILVEDVGGDVVLVNREFANLLQLNQSVDRLIGRKPPQGADLSHVVRDPQVFDRFVKECRLSPRSILNRRMFLRGNRVLECDYIPISDIDTGSRFGTVWQYRDVTASIRAADELKRTRDRAEAANRAKSDFLANMSHEIRTPLNAIIGFSELLEQKPLGPTELNYASAIGSSGRNLLRLINDILDLSKIEAGALELNPNPVDMKSLFEEILSIFQLKAEAKNLEISLEIEHGVPQYLFLDETRFRQIIFNLVGNAMKFTESGSISIDVRSVVQEPNQSVNLSVQITDTGIGIEENQLQEIFQTFSQQKGQDSHKYSGTGLGLSITKRLVEAMGGSVFVNSQRGSGSSFIVQIPNLSIPDEPVRKAKTWEITSFEPGLVLIVEDNQVNADLIGSFLKEFNLESIHLPSGEGIVDTVLNHKPILVLMDLHMPFVNGFEATRLLRNHAKTRHVPIIAVTADALSSKRQEAFEAGVDNLITKPFTKHGFNKVLARFLKPLKKTEPKPAPAATLARTPTQGLRVDRLQPALELLQGELRIKAEELRETMLMDEIRQLGQQVIEVSHRAGINFFEDWGKKIRLYADQFQIEEIEASLNRYNELLEETHALLREMERIGSGGS